MSSEDITIRFAHAVKARRKALGLSQEELAFRSGLHRTYIGAVERARRNITLRSADRIARALETSLDSLLKDT